MLSPLLFGRQALAVVALLGLLFCCFPVAAQNNTCVTNPSNESCAHYKMPSSMVQQAINDNCRSMPYMGGCTVQSICTAADASYTVSSSPYCQEFSVLKDLCVDMPGMTPCRNTYGSMCSSVSVVEECNTPALPLPKTMALQKTVQSMCSEMYMEPCSKCEPSNFRNCSLLQVYSEICLSMWMEGCEDWQTLCEVIPDWPLCPSGSSNDVPEMKMYFHTGIKDYVLFKEWVPHNDWQYALTLIAIILFGMLYELLKVGRSNWEGYVNKRQSDVLGHDEDGQTYENPSWGRRVWNFMKGWDWKVDIPRATMAFVETLAGLLLMLIAMSFNVGMFLAVCFGAFFGSLIFGRFANTAHMKHGCH